jgi:hypothetical protein
VPTELSWTEFRRAFGDLRALLAFRRSGLADKNRRRLRIGAGLIVALTIAAVVVPAYANQLLDGKHVGTFVALLPSFYLGFCLLSVVSAAASGGGREVVPREQAVAFPVSTTVEHLAALLMAPLNIAWFIQGWTILGLTAYVFGPHRLPLVIAPVLIWLFTATALAQVVGWMLEWIRRGQQGIILARLIVGATLFALLTLILLQQITHVLDKSPTVQILLIEGYGGAGVWWHYLLGVGVLVAIGFGAVLLGTVPARLALHRPLREELRLESSRHQARPNPVSDLAAMVRVDRAAIWRAVPLRRGLVVLALTPGLVAVAGNLRWGTITILPGLVVSGGALLFGVNSWCLDGRGALWRDSLPASPLLAFVSRVVVLAEVLLVAAAVTIVLATLRAGTPTPGEAAALACATVVVIGQVVSTSMRWSVNRPFAVDMRSARATPAPPVVMAGYSARLAIWTTVTGLIFSGLAEVDWTYSVTFALPMFGWSVYRLSRTAKQWAVPEIRSMVIATVSS